MKSCDLSNNEKYEALQSAQRFFGKCIEHVMGGDVKSLKSMFEVFQRENPLLSQIDIVENFRSEGKTFLHIAASSGCADVFNYIAKYASVDIMDSEDDHGYTPLINATACGNTEIVEFLLKKGARINHQNKDGASALHFAASEGSTHLLNLLLQRGADLNLLSQDAGTALHWAAGKAKIEAINVLVRHGALVNIKNRSDITPILMAAAANCDEGVETLIRAGAEIDSILVGNVTLLHMCSEQGMMKSLHALLATEVGRICVGRRTDEGYLPIHLAAMSGYHDAVAMLLPYSSSLLESSDCVESLMIEGSKLMQSWNERLRQTDELANCSCASDKNGDVQILISEALAANELSEFQSSSGNLSSDEWKLKGNENFQMKDFSGAILAYTNALLKQPQNPSVWSNRSAAYLKLGMAEKALVDAEICRKLNPNWSKGAYRLACARLALGLYEDAAVAAFEGTKLDSNNKELKQILRDAVEKGRQHHQRQQKHDDK